MPTVRHMSKEDYTAYRKLCSLCFCYPYEEAKDEPSPALLETTYGAFDEAGALLGGMIAHNFTASFGGKLVKLAGIGGVVSDPTRRKHGAIRSVFEKMLPELYEKGCTFSALYPFSHVFYRKFGYEQCFERRGALVPTDAIAPYQGEYTVRLMKKGDDVAPLMDIYAKYQMTMDFAITRSAEYYEQHLQKDALTHQHYVYLWEGAGGARGYVIGSTVKEKEEQGQFVIEDLAYSCTDALMGILGFLKGFNEFSELKLNTNEDVRWQMILAEPYDLSEKTLVRGMLRVVNVEKTLSLITPLRYNAKITLCVSDGQIDKNNGIFTVASQDGQITVVRSQEQPDLTLNIQALAQLLSGMADYRIVRFCANGITQASENPALPDFFPTRLRHMNDHY